MNNVILCVIVSVQVIGCRSNDDGPSLDNFVRPFWGLMYSQREWEDIHIYSTSTRHYGTTHVELMDEFTLTFQPPPSTMEISFPTLHVDEAWMNESCFQERSEERIRQYQAFRRKFTLPDDLISQTTVDPEILRSEMYSRSVLDNIRDIRAYFKRRQSTAPPALIMDLTPAIIDHFDTETTSTKVRRKWTRKTTPGTKKTTIKKKRKAKKGDKDKESGEESDYEDNEEVNEYDEVERMEHASAMDTEELIEEEKRIKLEKKEAEKVKKNVNIELRDYDEKNKTRLKYKHKEYVKKGYYFKDESAQFIHGSKEYLPNIKSNHTNLNKFIEKIKDQQAVPGVRTGYKYRKERYQQSGYEFRDEAGQFYRKNVLDSQDNKDYDTAFRYRDTIMNNSVGNAKAIQRIREGTQFKKGFGDTKDYENKFKHEYENYQDSRGLYKRKQEKHKMDKIVGKKENQHIAYEVKNEQIEGANGSRVNIDHFDYDKLEMGNTIKKRKNLPGDQRGLYIPYELGGGRFQYINKDVEERGLNQSYVMRHQRGRVQLLNNGSMVWATQPAGDGSNQTTLESDLLPATVLHSDELVKDSVDIGAEFKVNETGYNIRDEAFDNGPYLGGRQVYKFTNGPPGYKHNKSLGRIYSKLGVNGSYQDVVFKHLDTRYRNQDGYRKSDRKGHVFVKLKSENGSSVETKKAYNLVHEKLIQPDFKMINEKGFVQDTNNEKNYLEKSFTHYLKEFKSRNIKYSQRYDMVVNKHNVVVNNTKLNITYSKLMKKSHDRILYRAQNETWTAPWQDQMHQTMGPEMNYVPLLGTMEPPSDFIRDSEQTSGPVFTTRLFLLADRRRPNANSSTDYTYEDSVWPDTADPEFCDSKGNWIFPHSSEMGTTMATLSSDEIDAIYERYNQSNPGQRDQREFNYMDWEPYTEEPKTTHICQMVFNHAEKKMEYCKHPSHALTCTDCNKTFKGWFEYNLHQQAVNRKFKKYMFEEEGLFNDMITWQVVNGTLRPGVVNNIQIQHETPNRTASITKRPRGGMDFIPFERFNPYHFRRGEEFANYESKEETPLSEAEDDEDVYDSMRTVEEVTRPDFIFNYRINRSNEDNSFVPFQNYSDTEEDEDNISVMKLEHPYLYKDIIEV
uniref:Uncharacterized protein n=1 Tax=Cacopsylla melanoneura TaxID=428564 RepID=A0A8D8SXW8_9HEMI